MQEQATPELVSKNNELLSSFYNVFRSKENVRVYLCLVKLNDVEAVHSFFASENNGIVDPFITLNTNFSDSNNYAQQLATELNHWVANKKEQLEKQGVPFEFKLEDFASSPRDLLKNFERLQSQLCSEGQHLVIWFKPATIENLDEFESWLSLLLEESFPENVRFLIVHSYDEHEFLALQGNYENLVYTLVPELLEANPEYVEDPEGPTARFRFHFMELGKAAMQHDYAAVRNQGAEALKIAEEQENWEQLKVGIYLAMAEALIEDANNIEESMTLLNKAETAANKAIELENPNGSVMLIQAFIAKGSAHVYLQNFKAALALFESAIETAKRDEYLAYFELEGLRLAAICYEHFDDLEKAWHYNEDALTAAERLDPSIRKNTTLPYIGESMLRLAPIVNKGHEINVIHQKMVDYVGENWEEKL